MTRRLVTAGAIAIVLPFAACDDPEAPTIAETAQPRPAVSTAWAEGGVGGETVTLCLPTGAAGYRPITVSVAAESALRALGAGAVGEQVPDNPTMLFDDTCSPFEPQITFRFQGIVGLDCFFCGPGSDEFGSGVAPGTQLDGSFTFNPLTLPTSTSQPDRVAYVGVAVEVTVGNESVSGNDPSMARIEIANGPPSGDSYSLIVEGGFDTGTIAGVRIDQFTWVVSAPSTLFADTSLPSDPSFFGPLLGSRVCLGDCYWGAVLVLEGSIDALQLAP